MSLIQYPWIQFKLVGFEIHQFGSSVNQGPIQGGIIVDLFDNVDLFEIKIDYLRLWGF